MDVEHEWLEAVASVQADRDADVRDEAHEVFVAEASRSRLTDLAGPTRIVVRCGEVLTGRLGHGTGERLAGHLALGRVDGSVVHVPVGAVVQLAAPPARLRQEDRAAERSLASWLREAWQADLPVRCLLCTGHWITGRIGFVGADHVDVQGSQSGTTIAFAAVEAWSA